VATPPKTSQKRAGADSVKPATVTKVERAIKAPNPPIKPPHKREKLVRDSFTIPKGEYAVLESLKQRANGLTQPAKKSELLRAGIKALAAMDDAAFLAALQAVPAIKTGRPAVASAPVVPGPKESKAKPAGPAQ